MEEKSSGGPAAHTNALIGASSPYLRQHAHNPVDWYPWDKEVLARARRERKPLIVSIGYSACHWCHVMERESYSDPEIARFMNDHFIAMKVDREEHPEVDQIYMHASQLLTGAGGWPLNAFALPDGRPFYAVTYLPPERWLALLREIHRLFENRLEEVTAQAEALTEGIREVRIPDPVPHPDTDPRAPYLALFEKARSYLDPAQGGLGRAPKFPMPDVWEFLLQYHYLTGSVSALEAATRTLDHMAAGGIYDQIGGGFCRYATDAFWRVPHFEKMLYDNGQLVSLYAHAYQVTGKARYQEVVSETLDFVGRELTAPEGCFYASLNADSEGEEGKYYCWTEAEIDRLTTTEAARMLKAYYHVAPEGNWEDGKNILYTDPDAFTPAKPGEFRAARKALLEARLRRVPPSLDRKVLASWNALMIKGYVDAFRGLGTEDYLLRALRAARFLEEQMRGPDGDLYRSWMDGKASLPGVLEDYALAAEAFLALYEATLDLHWLHAAGSLTEYARAHFRDPATGLFFFSSDLHEGLVARKLDTEDNVIPSSNAVMAHVLYRLGVYGVLDAGIEEATGMLGRLEASVPAAVPYYARWARLMGMVGFGMQEVAVVGEAAVAVATGLENRYLPDCLFLGGDTESLPLLEGKLVPGRTRIYLCRGRVCREPVDRPEAALQMIRESRSRS